MLQINQIIIFLNVTDIILSQDSKHHLVPIYNFVIAKEELNPLRILDQ